MLNELKEKEILNWKHLDNQTFVTHYQVTSNERSKTQIYVKHYRAEENNEKSKTFFLLHDLGEYHGRYQQMISWFQQTHPEVSFIVMDYQGHGLSSGTRGHFDKFEYLVNDFLFLIEQFNKKNEKWFLLGHGLGGLVALDLLNRYQESVEDKIDGVVLSNFIVKFNSPLLEIENQVAEWGAPLKSFFSRMRTFRLKNGGEILTDPKDILAYEQDSLIIHRPTLNSIREIQKKTMNIYQDSYFLNKPILMLSSERNSGVLNKDMDHFARGIKKNLLTEKKYSLMKNDLYNERDKEYVFNDIAEWVKKYE